MDWFVDRAEAAGWTLTTPRDPKLTTTIGSTPGEMVSVERGGEQIQVEIGTGGIPHKVWRKMADGKITAYSQSYISMSEVASWLGEQQ